MSSTIKKIAYKLLGLLGEVGEILKVLFEDALQQELKIVTPIAIQAVRDIAADPTLITSDDKRDAALASIGTELLAQQKSVAASTISLALELAVKQLKSSQAQ